MPTVGIYAPSADGHRFKYVQYLISRIPADDHVVHVLTTDKALQSANYRLHLASLESRFKTQLVPNTSLSEIPYYSRRFKTDVMVLPDGDAYAWRHAWKRRWNGHGKLSVLVMRPHGQSTHAARRWVESMGKSILQMLTNTQKNVSIFNLQSSLWDPKKSGYGVPDPITFNPDAFTNQSLESISPLDVSHQWIALVGAITHRKNVPLVLKAVLQTNRDDVGVILAGRIDPNIRVEVEKGVKQLRKQGIPVEILDRLLSDGELDAIVARARCVVLAHSNEGPSGILGKAVEAGTFIVAAGAKSLRRDCQQVPQSSRWTPLKTESISKSINTALNSGTLEPKSLNTEFLFADRLLQRSSLEPDRC